MAVKGIKVNLVFEDNAWWAVLPDGNSAHAFEVDDRLNNASRKAQEKAIGWIWNIGWELGKIENQNRNMETFERPKAVSIKDWNGIDHWFVASEFKDGEIGQLSKEFASKEDAAQWMLEYS